MNAASETKAPDYLGHRQRLRQRFLLGEGKDMADYELLELVLTMAIPRRDVKPLAKRLIKRFGSFGGVINARAAELLEEEGVKENTLTMLKLIKAATVRVSWQTLKEPQGPDRHMRQICQAPRCLPFNKRGPLSCGKLQ